MLLNKLKDITRILEETSEDCKNLLVVPQNSKFHLIDVQNILKEDKLHLQIMVEFTDTNITVAEICNFIKDQQDNEDYICIYLHPTLQSELIPAIMTFKNRLDLPLANRIQMQRLWTEAETIKQIELNAVRKSVGLFQELLGSGKPVYVPDNLLTKALSYPSFEQTLLQYLKGEIHLTGDQDPINLLLEHLSDTDLQEALKESFVKRNLL